MAKGQIGVQTGPVLDLWSPGGKPICMARRCGVLTVAVVTLITATAPNATAGRAPSQGVESAWWLERADRSSEVDPTGPLEIGRGFASEQRLAAVHFDATTIPSGSEVHLRLDQTGADGNIIARPLRVCLASSAWTSRSAEAPTSDCLAFSEHPHRDGDRWITDISDAVAIWGRGEAPNRGLLIVPSEEAGPDFTVRLHKPDNSAIVVRPASEPVGPIGYVRRIAAPAPDEDDPRPEDPSEAPDPPTSASGPRIEASRRQLAGPARFLPPSTSTTAAQLVDDHPDPDASLAADRVLGSVAVHRPDQNAPSLVTGWALMAAALLVATQRLATRLSAKAPRAASRVTR